MRLNNLFLPIFILFFALRVFPSDFSAYFAGSAAQIYTQSKTDIENIKVENKDLEKIISVYSGIYDHRLNRETDKDALSDRIENLISDLNKGRISGLNAYEKDLVTAFLYGSLAYVNSDDTSYKMFSSLRQAKKLFEKLNSEYKKQDSEFGTALSGIALALYFQDSFWIRSVFGYKGNIADGLKKLDTIAFTDCLTSAEANLFLIDYYAQILQDHKSSSKYSKNLHDLYPSSKYFSFLYAKDLYHTGKIFQASELFKKITGNVGGGKFYPFEYESIIYEAKCLYLLNEREAAAEVIRYAIGIHDGYIIEKFKNEWMSSIRMRQEVVFRAQYGGQTEANLSTDEIIRTAGILFDHGYLRELKRLIEASTMADFDLAVLNFRVNLLMDNYGRAYEILKSIESKFGKKLKKYPDLNRLMFQKNIVLNLIK
jgi:hypothetical protein